MDKATDNRLCEIRSYVDGTRIRSKDQSSLLTSKDLLALGEFTRQDLYGAILLAFFYGRAKGYRVAKGLPLTLQPESGPSEDAEILRLAKSLDEVQLAAVLVTAQELAAGTDPVAALAAGNIVLVSAGSPPAPVYIPEDG